MSVIEPRSPPSTFTARDTAGIQPNRNNGRRSEDQGAQTRTPFNIPLELASTVFYARTRGSATIRQFRTYRINGVTAKPLNPSISGICETCAHLRRGDENQHCNAFPEGIPLPIWLGEHDHRTPFVGDSGIQWAINDGCTPTRAEHLRAAAVNWAKTLAESEKWPSPESDLLLLVNGAVMLTDDLRIRRCRALFHRAIIGEIRQLLEISETQEAIFHGVSPVILGCCAIDFLGTLYAGRESTEHTIRKFVE